MVDNTIRSNVEAVILVHGTFAGDPSDHGQNWWQRDSEVWHSLVHALPDRVEIQDPFHWGKGPNSYRERVRAGMALLDRLLALEEDGRGYHLIGHSHGGSVIWECLCQASFESGRKKGHADQLRLPNLRSWTTVGTPFVEYVVKTRFWHRLAMRPAVDTPVAKPSAWSNPRFLSVYMRIVFNFSLILIGIWFAGGLIEILLPGVVPKDLASLPLWQAVLGALWIILMGATWLPQIEQGQANHERYLTTFAVKRFADRWLGIYSPQDEAISVLRTSTDLNLNVVPKRQGGRGVFYSDKLFASVHWSRRIIDVLYNLVVPRLGNKFISSQLESWVLGSDRPGCEAVAVRTHPTVLNDFDMPLPEHINKPLVDLADSRASKLAPECRRLLYSLDGSNVRFAEDGDTDLTSALVHNSYFHVDEVIQLIASHVDSTSRGTQGEDIRLRAETRIWKESFASTFADHVRRHYEPEE